MEIEDRGSGHTHSNYIWYLTEHVFVGRSLTAEQALYIHTKENYIPARPAKNWTDPVNVMIRFSLFQITNVVS